MKKLSPWGLALVLLFVFAGPIGAGEEPSSNEHTAMTGAAAPSLADDRRDNPKAVEGAASPDADDLLAVPTSPAPGQASDKWALLVGINEYANEDITDLKGAVNDVHRMKALLKGKFAFPEDHIKVLTDQQATHDAITEAFQDHLIKNARRGDIVVFHYSGHGSQMRDQPGDAGDEIDGMDETIVPSDSRMEGHFDITDDEINGLLQLLAEKTENITFIFDSCHSGTASRGGGLARNIPPDTREPPPPPTYAVSARGSQPMTIRQPQVNYVLLSGARSDQLAREYKKDGLSYGAFTYFLTEEIEHAGAGVTYRDVMDKVKEKVNRYYGTQNPQVEGTQLDQYVFSDASSIAEPFVLVSSERANRVQLNAGQVHGMTEGSVFEVYAPGTKTFVAGQGLARVELTKVNPLDAEAKILEGSPIPESARAVEREHQFPDQKLLVHYRDLSASSTLQAVKAELDQLNHIQAAAEDDSYHLVLREQGGRIFIEGLDETVESEPVPTGEAGAVEHVVEQVRQWTKWFNLLSIDNPAPKAQVELTILVDNMEGSRDPFNQPDQIEGVTYHEEVFRCIVKNRSKKDLFIAILDLSTDGSISIIYPEQTGAAGLLKAGEEYTTEDFEFFVADGRASVKDVIKVFATATPVDFSVLTQFGIRDTRQTTEDPLGQLLAQATLGAPRGSRKKVRSGDWVTAQRAVLIKRRP